MRTSHASRRSFCATVLNVPLAAAATKSRALNPSGVWDSEGQLRRRAQIYRLQQSSVGALFDESGAWTAKSTEPGGRERLWNCLSFLKGAATRDKGNAIIARTFTERSRFSPFSHFEFVTAVQLLSRDEGELTVANKQLLTSLVKEALAHQGELRFMGYNDNFPAMENEVASLGGELVDNAAARSRGLSGMHRVLELLDRRGLLSEYTGSTYSPVTMLCYSGIAQYAQDKQARELALEIERRVWMDIAAHFHSPTNILAGPHSRAYAVDTVGHLHQVHMLLYQAFGEQVWMNPARFLFPPVEKQVIHHDGDVPFMQVSAVWIASGAYHPTVGIERLLFNKTFPCRVTATSEYGSAAESIMLRNARSGGQPVKVAEPFEYPAGETVTTTFLTADYALGTATAPFLDGNQTDTFFVNFRRTEKPDSLHDVSTIFSRFCVDDYRPGEPWTDPRSPGKEVTVSLLGESGRTRTVQKDGTAIVAYQSKQQFVGEYKALRLTVAIPTFYRDLKRITVGGQEVTLPFRSNTPATVFIEDAYLYAAVRPLSITNHGRGSLLHIEKINGYLAIHFINHEGAWRNFSRAELAATLNGFVAEIASPGDYSSPAAFRAMAESAALTDETNSNQRVISYQRPGVRLGLSYSILLDGMKYATVDGKELARPAFQIDSTPQLHQRRGKS